MQDVLKMVSQNLNMCLQFVFISKFVINFKFFHKKLVLLIFEDQLYHERNIVSKIPDTVLIRI